MFRTGNILYFEPFVFSDGSKPKNKYFIVLKTTEKNIILASLPTSKDAVPNHIIKVLGCIELSSINFNCFYFLSCVEVATNESTNNRFSFPQCTYVYGYRINEFNTDTFSQQLINNNTNISIKGKLDDNVYNNLIACLKTSYSVKKRYKKLL